MTIQGYEVIVISKDEVSVGCIHVARKEIEKVLSLMNAYAPPQPKFQVGDFVRVLGSQENAVPCGEHGEVIDVDRGGGGWERYIGVKFSRRSYKLHDCNGRTRCQHGYWFRPDELEKVD